MTGSIDTVSSAPAGVIEARRHCVSPVMQGRSRRALHNARSGSRSRSRVRPAPPAGRRSEGPPIVVRQGETAASLSNRYNVPASAILQANGLSREADVAPGASIVIPVYNAGGNQTASTRSTAPTPRAQSAQPERSSEGMTASRSAPTRLDVSPPPRPDSIDQRAPRAGKIRRRRRLSASRRRHPRPPRPRSRRSSRHPCNSRLRVWKPSAVQQAGLDFRWPARGRVIAGFGTGGNEGINIALPEGTPVRAAEGGTVAYAGSELKGYGNLILIKHDDGYVSAYAHNRDLMVERGDSVRRGQVIANSGRTGNVNAPQLHFEIRKGSDPVDPMPYLRS